MKHKQVLVTFISIVIFISCAGLLWGQSNPLLEADYAVFKYDSSQVYWEIYYAIHQNYLTYIKENSEFSTVVLLQLSIYKDDTLWTTNGWKMQSTVKDTAKTTLWNDLVDRVYLLAPEGNYAVTLTAKDLNNPSLNDSTKFDAFIKPFSPGNVALSDVELASSIERKPEAKESPFYKNTLLVIPNPTKLFGEQADRLFFYIELYNLKSNISETRYTINYYISDLNGKLVDQVPPVRLTRKKQYDTKIEYGALNIGLLPSSNYSFNFEISDSSGNMLTSTSKKFFIYKPENDTARQQIALDEESIIRHSEFSSMEESELDKEFEFAGYILSKEQKKSYKSLTNIDAKKRFLYLMWRPYDPDPKTMTNEFRKEYMDRVSYSNENFKAMKREGWQTDRGRVHITYGKPDYVEKRPYEADLKPYEIWSYNAIQGGVIFVFGKLKGFRDYELIHSTARGEIQHSDYMQILKGGYLY